MVVNWIKTFSISEENGDVVDCLKKAVKEFNPGHDSYEESEREIAKVYKQGIIPFNAIHERYNGDLGRLFTFATKNKINVALGDNKTLLEDINSIGTSIVIDALTLTASEFVFSVQYPRYNICYTRGRESLGSRKHVV